MSRGSLVVFEGCDGVGKTTQCKYLVQRLKDNNIQAQYLSFPNRNSKSGKIINSFLTGKIKLENNNGEIEELFAENRRESKDEMLELMNNGVTLIVDRYTPSAIAYGMVRGHDKDWLKNLAADDIKIDLTIYLYLNNVRLKNDEIYDNVEFQNSVSRNFSMLIEEDWKILDGNMEMMDIAEMCYLLSIDCIEKCKNEPIL